jgi:hypothetical protein
VVSAEVETVNVHQGLLCKSSEFFKRAMKPEWASLREDPHTIHLSEDTIEVVILYVRWLYRPELQVEVTMPEDNSDACRGVQSEKLYTELAEAYVFGEKILDASFKNAAVQKFLEVQRILTYSPGPCSVAIVYAGTTTGSRLRHLITDLIAYNASGHESWGTYFEEYPREALIDAIKAINTLRGRSGKSPYLSDHKKYLEDEDQVNLINAPA